jgi:peptide/nickel transport system substrate-binding protein
MQTQGYWESITRNRIKRRRFLGATALGTSAFALSISCGGGDDDSSGGEGLVAKLEDSTSRAKAGGVLKDYSPSDVTSFDALASSTSASNQVANRVYSRLLRQTTVKYPDEASLDLVEGDLAESYEMSSDKLQITMKLRQGPKWDPQAPTSGRAIDAQDVMFSWDKFSRLSNFRGTLAYDASTAPLAPIESVNAPDSRTIIFKLHQPFSDTLGLMTSYLYISPREADGGVDPRGQSRG